MNKNTIFIQCLVRICDSSGSGWDPILSITQRRLFQKYFLLEAQMLYVYKHVLCIHLVLALYLTSMEIYV